MANFNTFGCYADYYDMDEDYDSLILDNSDEAFDDDEYIAAYDDYLENIEDASEEEVTEQAEVVEEFVEGLLEY